jgi:hypothetical protein
VHFEHHIFDLYTISHDPSPFAVVYLHNKTGVRPKVSVKNQIIGRMESFAQCGD